MAVVEYDRSLALDETSANRWDDMRNERIGISVHYLEVVENWSLAYQIESDDIEYVFEVVYGP
jgi:hypothetical protein